MSSSLENRQPYAFSTIYGGAKTATATLTVAAGDFDIIGTGTNAAAVNISLHVRQSEVIFGIPEVAVTGANGTSSAGSVTVATVTGSSDYYEALVEAVNPATKATSKTITVPAGNVRIVDGSAGTYDIPYYLRLAYDHSTPNVVISIVTFSVTDLGAAASTATFGASNVRLPLFNQLSY